MGKSHLARTKHLLTDESYPTYEDVFENIIIGHKYLKTEFGGTPGSEAY